MQCLQCDINFSIFIKWSDNEMIYEKKTFIFMKATQSLRR